MYNQISFSNKKKNVNKLKQKYELYKNILTNEKPKQYPKKDKKKA